MPRKAGMVSLVKDIAETTGKSLILTPLLFLTLALTLRKAGSHFRKFELAELSKNVRILTMESRKFPVYPKSVFPHVYT